MKEVKLHNNEIEIIIDSLKANIHFGYESERSKRIIDKMQKAKAFDLGAVSKCTCLQDCDNCGAKQVQFISTGNEVCPKCFC